MANLYEKYEYEYPFETVYGMLLDVKVSHISEKCCNEHSWIDKDHF